MSAQLLQQPQPQRLFQNDPGYGHGRQDFDTQLRRDHLSQQQQQQQLQQQQQQQLQQQQEYDALAFPKGYEHSPAVQHTNQQEWYGALQREQQHQHQQHQQPEEHLRHTDQQLASAMEQRLKLTLDDQPVPDTNGPQQPLGATDPNRHLFQQHLSLPTNGLYGLPGFPGVQLPPGFAASSSSLGRLPGGDSGAAEFPGYDHRRTPPLHLEPNFNIQGHAPMFGHAKASLGAPPGLGSSGGPFMSLDAGSGSVSQQLDAYQERLHTQLQIQQQLLQQQHHLHQLYLFQQQQQQQQHLGLHPALMDQHQLPPFFMMPPPGQGGSETGGHPQQLAHPPGFLQGGAPHLMPTRDIGASSMPLSLSVSAPLEQQEQTQQIQRHLSDLLFESYNKDGSLQGEPSQTAMMVAQAEIMGTLPKTQLSLEEIEAAQFLAHKAQHHHQQKPRKSLSDLVLPPEAPLTDSVSMGSTSSRNDGVTESRGGGSADHAPPPAVSNVSTLMNSGERGRTGAMTGTSSVAAAGGDHHRYSHLPDQHRHGHQQQQNDRRKGSFTHDTPFSIKDTNLFNVPKYDPYRPSQGIFETITMEMKNLCEELLPNPAEETRKLGLLDRLQELANEVFGEADILPFGSSGNGLALANADMDLCVFLPEQSKKRTVRKRRHNREKANFPNLDQKDGIEGEEEKKDGEGEEEKEKKTREKKAEENDTRNEQEETKEGQQQDEVKEEEVEEEEEVSAAEFVERMGDRLEEDTDFRDVLQLRKARVPIVKLVHSPTGIACDIGYENHLALWNTRLLRAYSRIDGRLRELVSIIKYWAKQRKLNNPYVGTLSSYAYVLLVIHVLQVRGVLPNLQRITVDNSGRIPFWDCQGFNRYFFEDVSELDNHWRPTEESRRQSVGELLYEFFRYFVNEFRYATQVVSIRKGGLLTKDEKEWSKEFLQAENRPHTGVRSRYLFCIEDPFEVDHNVARTVDRYTLFTIRGEFMRATKVLSRGGDNIIGRLCQEKEDPPPLEGDSNGGGASREETATAERDGDGGEQEGGHRPRRRPSEDGSTLVATKPPPHSHSTPSRPSSLFPEGDEPIRTNGGGGSGSGSGSNTTHGGSVHAGRDSHYGGNKRTSTTPRDGHHHYHNRLSHHQQPRQQQQQQQGFSQSQRDPYKRASLAGGSHGANSRDRPRQ
ncbi:hypothetical protein DFQ27_005180 [Actinomortierella ambigua]|uniref:polynucleotide adenylyltransferase n=1 Tax=Actinomortierella ambigua TaxID=1343610 RepID=A0A9P6Q1N5_9FUNG|nr:hypothetical protein DFQ27_005180 [Actinomortierella ambigua]